ncbi:ZDHHC2_15_20 [Lepeophtheirus salmonis]|nr:ZDHHC2_15_20 [Lepeophtheirus salmonis]
MSPPPKGTCARILWALKWIPVMFIMGIVVWSYFAYVFHLVFLTVQEPPLQVIFFVLYHIFLFLFVTSYWKTVLTHGGSVPPAFKLSAEELDNIEAGDPKMLLEDLAAKKDLPLIMRSMNGEIRICMDCRSIKPDRAHHCSVCGICVLKMDHHCPWVNNCVAFFNYKFFILFLGYALLYCLYVAMTSFRYFLLFWNSESPAHGKFHVLFLFFVSSMFSVSLCFLFIYHCYLISRNLTTLEAFRAPIFHSGVPDRKGFHLGSSANFQEIFGDRMWTWFAPIFSSLGDGLHFPIRGQLYGDEELGVHSTSIGMSRNGGRHLHRGQMGRRGEDFDHINMSLSGKVCVVTGASRGIGRGIAVQTADEIKSRGGNPIMIQMDHSNDEEILGLFNRIRHEQKGKLDLLVNNAFGGVKMIIENFGKNFWEALSPVQMWDKINGVGLRDHYICTSYASRIMQSNRSGLIVNVSSGGGIKYVLNVPYGVGKAASDRMVADCAHELKKCNVAMVSLWPGAVKTEEMTKYVIDNPGASAGLKSMYANGYESPEFSGMAVVKVGCRSKYYEKDWKDLDNL